MIEETPLAIPRNPAQIPASQFRLSRNLKVRGDAIYIIFGGIIGAVFLFFVLMDASAILDSTGGIRLVLFPIRPGEAALLFRLLAQQSVRNGSAA